MKKAAIVGAFEYEGFKLCEKLLHEGIEVIAIDAPAPNEEVEEIREDKRLQIGRNSNYRIIETHIENVKLEDLNGITTMYYCTPINCQIEDQQLASELTAYINLLLSFCSELNAHFVYLSSIDVYGNGISNEVLTIKEPALGRNLLNELERTVSDTADKDNVHYTIARLASTYGPDQPEERVYHRALNGQKQWCVENINENSRDCIYIDDATQALYLIGVKKDVPNVINIASGTKDNWRKGLEFITKNTIELPSLPTVSIQTMKNHLQFTPQVAIEEGIVEQKLTIERTNRFFL